MSRIEAIPFMTITILGAVATRKKRTLTITGKMVMELVFRA
jgi:hypothetical protein